MRTIKLKSLSLVNFKGIRNLTIDFNDAETLVCGGNGTGKTTIFDSFCGCYSVRIVPDVVIQTSISRLLMKTVCLFCIWSIM